MKNIRGVVGNIGWLCIDKIWRMGVGLLVGVWLARYLGPEQYGILNYAQAFVTLFASFAGLGLDGIAVRQIVKEPTHKDEILGTSLYLKAVGGLLSFIITVVVMVMVPPHDYVTKYIIVIISLGTIFQAFDAIDFWFQAEVKSKYTVYAKNGAFGVATVLKVILLIINAQLIAFAWVGLLEIIFGGLGMVIVYRFQGGSIKAFKYSFLRAKQLLRDSWPLILSGIVIMIYMRIDQIMLGQMVGERAVGIYSVAVKLAEIWYFIPISIVSSFFPSIVEAKERSEELFYHRLQRLYNLMALLAYAVAVPTTFLAGWVIQKLYGDPYIDAGPMLAVFIWAGIFTNLGIARSAFLTAMNWTKVHFFTTALGCILNIILNFILIPTYEGMGAAIASLIAYWVASHGACLFYRPLWNTGLMLSRAIILPIHIKR